MLGRIHDDLPPGVRTYGPSDVQDQFHIHKKKDEILAVRAKIERIYSSLSPDSHKGLLEMGFCIGLLDPRSNIIMNLAISSSRECPAAQREPSPLAGGGEGTEPSPPAGREGGREPSPAAGGGGGREHVPPRARGVKRGRVREPLTPAQEVEAKVEEMAQRSLDGLTAFLTCLFPYLPDAEARKYLDAAGADPLVASLIVIRRRNMKMFGTSQTTQAAVEVALRCAAVAANHPDPQRFVRGWKFVSPYMEMLVSPAAAAVGVRALSHVSTSTDEGTFFFRALEAIKAADTIALDPVLVLDVPWYLAKRRMGQLNPESDGLPPVRAHIKRVLLAKIHGLYMEALGRLPKVELQSCYHHSLLMGGYCYGPFDPLSNILLNTIWYKQNFPPSKKFEISMISTNLLWSVVARSLYGLISFLCTLLKGITPDQAMESLLMSNIYLPAAIDALSDGPTTTTSLFDDSPAQPLPASVADAYAAAGAAAFHRSPLAQSQFLSSDIIDDAFRSFPQHYRDGCPLSFDDINSVCRILESCSAQQKDVTPTKVKKRVYANMSHCIDSFWGQHDRVTTMVRDALDKFNKTAVKGQLFELHIIFGVNEFVSGPVRSMDGKVGKYNPWTHDKFFHSHINFLAICKDRPLNPPTLFFAECGKDGADTCWCVPVIPQNRDAEKPRCIYCEHEANRIVHPTVEGFYGRDEFVELFYSSDREYYNNDKIISYNKRYVDWVHGIADGAIYLDFYPDNDDDGGDEADWIEIY